MTNHNDHNKEVVSQFTKQAIPFTRLSGHSDSLYLIVKISQTAPTKNVLDVASGPGIVGSAFAKHSQSVECLDLTPAMLEQAKIKAEEEGLANMSFCEGNAMNLPYEDNTFDVVVTRYSFHHFLEPEKVLKEMIRVCKPKGCVVVADVAIEAKFQDKFNNIERLRDSSHVSALTIDEFEQLFSITEFESCSKSNYLVNVELEKQLSVSFPKKGDDIKIRDLITQDVEHNHTGFNPQVIKGEVFYSYPISIYAGIKI